ncbi:TfoX/Sxy family protein [Xanthobacter autotrophicus]|uniref:TfoX/Sxy family protein n=1 Tax=Xanthobacter autotrophicus TaxID=280 RepID=UPI0037264FAE
MDEDTIADLFSAFGDVRTRRLFGGRGVYADGLMFAIEVGGILYLKADADHAALLESRGSVPFSYLAKGAVRTMTGFWSVPEAALDDGDDLAALARRSLALARAAAARKPAKTAATRPKKKTPRG